MKISMAAFHHYREKWDKMQTLYGAINTLRELPEWLSGRPEIQACIRNLQDEVNDLELEFKRVFDYT